MLRSFVLLTQKAAKPQPSYEPKVIYRRQLVPLGTVAPPEDQLGKQRHSSP